MITLLGVSGDIWSLVIQLAAMAVSFFIGLRSHDRPLLRVTVPIGIAANLLGQVVFAGGGPGACAGMVLIPIYCLVAAYIGRGGWWLFVGRMRRPLVCDCGATTNDHSSSVCRECGTPINCHRCGYNLRENESGRCPECGDAFALAIGVDAAAVRATRVAGSGWKPVIRAAVVVLILTTIVVVYLRSDYHRHNRFLARLRTSLSSLPLPAQTTKLASVSRVGLLAGNGNHCDYAVAEMHSTKLGRDEILRHYNQQSVPNPEGPSRFGVEVAFFDGNSPPTFGLYDPLFSCAEASPGELRYVVGVILIGYHDAGFDPRCH